MSRIRGDESKYPGVWYHRSGGKNSPDPEEAFRDMRKITLYTRSECHLCDEAKAAMRKHFPRLAIEEIDVDASPELTRLHGEEVPVGYLGETKAFKFHLDVERLRRLLARGAGKP